MTQTFSAYHRAIWLSDLHLGEKHCKADYLLSFLEKHDAEQLFLVGDVVDIQALSRRHFWPEKHQQVFDLLCQRARNGCKVIYIPGNHDIQMRQYAGGVFDTIEIHQEYIYDSPYHGRLLMLHGDVFDRQLCSSKLEAWFGDRAYDLVLFLNRIWNLSRRSFGLQYQSVARMLKRCSSKAERAMSRFRHAAIQRAIADDVDGIVCGHIHFPELRTQADKLYINTGDWVENCTAVIEHMDGRLELNHYSEAKKPLQRLVPQQAVVTS
ncbi:UDP-2,3-diacylglucosamine diphosphatase [Shewanella avicenniae]|uniref:UDP-2,3-diacylglucosamine diphosphatase n=1 Tax=Shewanella avicenniae TaxID=2814294 RepID=A0ABX7QSA3_9GAMM|nr:UDP-2,3-diacylglucosamine diphosphatase [Shewanella avicenniae]QSX34284.1 UDP-2,3-diacylglucosamine diphosphatase [Shewanella avicenniae]